MQFVQFGMLGAMAALAIPIAIHLMFRQRARPIDLGTLQFLKVVLRDNARRRRLKRYILLALRLTCVALLAMMFARPYLLAVEKTSGNRLLVVLLDRSASMGLKGARAFENALAEARTRISRAGQGTQVEVATFDRGIHPVAKASDLVSSAPMLSASGTDYGVAMAWARDLCVRSRQDAKELYILTDLQRSGLDRGESVTVPPDVDVHLIDYGRAFPKNVGVVGLAVTPKGIRPGDSATVTATVLNASPLPIAKALVRLHLEGGEEPRELTKTIDLEGGTSTSVSFKLEALPEALWRGYVAVEVRGDQLPFDDRRYLALQVAPPARVVLLDGAPRRSQYEAETYFLQAAIRLAAPGERYTKSPFEPKVVEFTPGASLPDLQKAQAVVLANVGSLSASDAHRLATFVQLGGGLLVFTGDRVRPESARVLEAAGLGVGEVKGIASAADRPWRLERWDTGHPLFKPFDDPEHGDLRRPGFATITKIVPDRETRVLAWFRGGEPALLERALGRGRVVWFASACDRGWGDWPRSRLYVPMVHQMLAHATGLAEGGRVRQELADAEHPPGVVEADGRLVVRNADPFESETARCTPKEFASKFGFRLPEPKAAVANVGKHGERGPADDRLRGDEIWPWLALGLVGILLVENFLANRTAA